MKTVDLFEMGEQNMDEFDETFDAIDKVFKQAGVVFEKASKKMKTDKQSVRHFRMTYDSTEEGLQLKFKKLDPAAKLPEYKTAGAAGMDVCTTMDISLRAGEVMSVPTGLAVEIPEGFELQVRPRSGLATKGLTVVNSPGTIDSDYRGEIRVILALFGPISIPYPAGGFVIRTIDLKKGDRIAQLVLARSPRLPIVEVEELSDTKRGKDGFGSTGK